MGHHSDQTEEEFLAAYDIHQFDVPLVSVDVVIFTIRKGRLHVLLTKRPNLPQRGRWALPGGFLQLKTDPDLVSAALRKLEEKTGVRSPYLEQLQTFGNNSRDPRGWSVTVVYFALINTDEPHFEQMSEEARWTEVNEPLLGDLAFDHELLLKTALNRLRAKVSYSALPVHLLAEEFTLNDLKAVYDIILEKNVEKSAFRRRIKEIDVIEEIPGKKRLASNRPAQLYRVKPNCSSYFFTANLKGVD